MAVYGHIHPSDQGQLIINPGATGQPYSPYAKFMADQRAHYAILTVTDAGQLSVDFRKVSYDISQEIARAKQQELPYFDLYRHLRQGSAQPGERRSGISARGAGLLSPLTRIHAYPVHC